MMPVHHRKEFNMNTTTAKQNLIFGKSMRKKSNDARLLYFIAFEVADGVGLFDTTFVLDIYHIPESALRELIDAKLLLFFEEEGVAAIVHWTVLANASQKSKQSLFPEIKNRLVIRNGKYTYKEPSSADDAELIYMD